MKTSRPKQKRPARQGKPSSIVVEVITDLDLDRVSGSDASGRRETSAESGSLDGVDGSGGGSGSGSGSGSGI